METGFIALIVLALFLGIIIGIFLGWAKPIRTKTKGVIHVDHSDPVDGPYLFLELSVPVRDIVAQKQVTLDVDVTQYISQE